MGEEARGFSSTWTSPHTDVKHTLYTPPLSLDSLLSILNVAPRWSVYGLSLIQSTVLHFNILRSLSENEAQCRYPCVLSLTVPTGVWLIAVEDNLFPVDLHSKLIGGKCSLLVLHLV